jgi:hypothetical protein
MPFTHPNFGKMARVELCGREVRLVFVADNIVEASNLAGYLVGKLKDGAVNITLMGRPTSVEET